MTPAQFKEAIPAFAGADDGRISYWLTQAVAVFDVSAWGGFYERGLSNWVAHQLVMETATGADASSAGGAATASRMKVGQIEVQQSDKVAEMAAQNELLGTRYGRVYDQLSTMVGMGAVAV